MKSPPDAVPAHWCVHARRETTIKTRLGLLLLILFAGVTAVLAAEQREPAGPSKVSHFEPGRVCLIDGRMASGTCTGTSTRTSRSIRLFLPSSPARWTRAGLSQRGRDGQAG